MEDNYSPFDKTVTDDENRIFSKGFKIFFDKQLECVQDGIVDIIANGKLEQAFYNNQISLEQTIQKLYEIISEKSPATSNEKTIATALLFLIIHQLGLWVTHE